MIKLAGGSAYDEVNGIGRVVSALPTSDLQWTLFRYSLTRICSFGKQLTFGSVPLLTNGEAKPVRAGMIGEGQDGIVLSRRSIAVWILQELSEKKWIGKAPALCNPGLI